MSSFVSYKRFHGDQNYTNNNITNDIIKKNITNDLNFELELDNCIKKCNEDFEKEVKRRGLRHLLKFNEFGMLLPEKKSKKKSKIFSIKHRVLRERKKRAKIELKLLVRNRNKCIELCKAQLEMKYLNLIMKKKGMDEDTEGLIGQYLLPRPKKGEWIVHNIKFKKSKTRKSSSKTKNKSVMSKSKKNKSKSQSKKKGGSKIRKKSSSKTKKKSHSK